MGGEWITSEELYENGDPTNQIEQENMVLRMNGCAAVGTLADNGEITNAYFAGGVANNLVGKWSLSGYEMGTFS